MAPSCRAAHEDALSFRVTHDIIFTVRFTPLYILLLVLGYGLLEGRLHLIRGWFQPGPVRVQQPGTSRPHRGPLNPTRVVLIDGLTAHQARRLPTFKKICDAGISLRVDVGFPTVSLPVQHALWTGAWQTQSGIQFVLGPLAEPVFETLPQLVTRRSANAVAVAESHREIADSFGFSQVIAPLVGQPPFSELTLQQHALSAVQSNAALVLIHTLAVDHAGHTHGALSPEYRAAAQRSDRLLTALWQSRSPTWSLLVLSDHGHLPLGGHGDVEPQVRFIQACLVGPGLEPGGHGRATIVDLNRILADRLQVAVPATSVGRPLNAVLARGPLPQQPFIALPLSRLAVALLVGLMFLLPVGLHFAGGQAWGAMVLSLPWSMVLSLVFLVAGGTWPSLSQAFIYPKLPAMLLATSLPGALFIGLQLWTLMRLKVTRLWATLAILAGVLSPTLCIALLSGWPLSRPALVPYFSGWASTLLIWAAVHVVFLAIWNIAIKTIGSVSPAGHISQ